jgi:hypothetical protein
LPAVASAVAPAVTALVLAVANPGQVVLTLQDPTIEESSGLAVSQRHDGVLWTHNDGGAVAQVLAVDRTGQTVARVTLAGIDPYDPEALAPGTGPDGEPVLYLGDIGDNDRDRPDVSVFRFDEPEDLTDQTVGAQWYRFTYPDGPHDAEALLVDPQGRLLVATKGISGQGLYRAPRRLVTQDQGTNRLTRIAGVPTLVTDGAYLPDGRFVLRTYSAAFVYDRPGHQVAVEELPGQLQGESVAVDGDRLLIGSEGAHSEVLAVPVPGPSAPTPAGTRGSTQPSRGPDSGGQDTGGDGLATGWPLVLVAGAVVLAAAVVLRRRR